MNIEEYLDPVEGSVFQKWFKRLDTQAALTINTVLTRMKHGNTSNIKGVGNGVYERTIDQGPGYRIYFGKDGLNSIILLCGGSKRRQQRDVDKAKVLWTKYKEMKIF